VPAIALFSDIEKRALNDDDECENDDADIVVIKECKVEGENNFAAVVLAVVLTVERTLPVAVVVISIVEPRYSDCSDIVGVAATGVA